jgi:hypothetical protein
LRRKGLSSAWAKTGALAQTRIKAMKKGFIVSFTIFFTQRRNGAK